MDKTETKKIVREGYAKLAKQSSAIASTKSACCGSSAPSAISKQIGYSDDELTAVPEGANLGLGCGNPLALASVRDGDVVLDLGSGAGFDCFLAAKRVGDYGKVIGVDMTPEMLDKARENALKGKYNNVEFRLGEIENLPLADNFVDLIISNCVINLATDKKRVFQEAFRVLKPGGRLMISDIVTLKPMPEAIMSSITAYVGCISGAMVKDQYLKTIKSAGFSTVQIVEETAIPFDAMANDPTVRRLMSQLSLSTDVLADLASSMVSVRVSGVKSAR